DAGEAGADDDLVADADAPLQLDPVALLSPVGEHREHVGVVAAGPGVRLESDPLDVGVEQLGDGVEISGEEGAIALEDELDALLAHTRNPSAAAEDWIAP